VSSNYQRWTISGTPSNINAGSTTSYWNVPVTLITATGVGYSNFTDNHQLFLGVYSQGSQGVQGPQGYQGRQGPTGSSGPIGATGSSAPYPSVNLFNYYNFI
jgi:hypothetical protein